MRIRKYLRLVTSFVMNVKGIKYKSFFLARVLISMLPQLETEKHRHVKCDICKRTFPDIGSPTQGRRCAVTLNKNGITGHSGSYLFDTSLAPLASADYWPKLQSDYQLDDNANVCDWCIYIMVEQGLFGDSIPVHGTLRQEWLDWYKHTAYKCKNDGDKKEESA